MAHKLTIAKKEYADVSKIMLTDTSGNQCEYVAADEVYSPEQIALLAEMDDRTLKLIDTSNTALSENQPAKANEIWMEADGHALETLSGAMIISHTQPADTSKIWIETEE